MTATVYRTNDRSVEGKNCFLPEIAFDKENLNLFACCFPLGCVHPAYRDEFSRGISDTFLMPFFVRSLMFTKDLFFSNGGLCISKQRLIWRNLIYQFCATCHLVFDPQAHTQDEFRITINQIFNLNFLWKFAHTHTQDVFERVADFLISLPRLNGEITKWYGRCISYFLNESVWPRVPLFDLWLHPSSSDT